MSQVSKALKKIQEMRQASPEQEQLIQGQDVVNMAQNVVTPKSPKKNEISLLFGLGLIASMLLSSVALFGMTRAELNEKKMFELQAIISMQNQKIGKLIVLMGKSKNDSRMQMKSVGLQVMALQGQINDFQYRINSLASGSKDTYDALKSAILDDKQKIGYLDSYAKKLNQKIEGISASADQGVDQTGQVPVTPAISGN